jgi:hypothetical protein
MPPHEAEIKLAVGDEFSYKLKTPARTGYSIDMAMSTLYTWWYLLLDKNSIVRPTFMEAVRHDNDLQIRSTEPVPAGWHEKEVHVSVRNKTRFGFQFSREKVIVHIKDNPRDIPDDQPRLTRWQADSPKRPSSNSPLLQHSYFSPQSRSQLEIKMTQEEIKKHNRETSDGSPTSPDSDQTSLLSASVRPRIGYGATDTVS